MRSNVDKLTVAGTHGWTFFSSTVPDASAAFTTNPWQSDATTFVSDTTVERFVITLSGSFAENFSTKSPPVVSTREGADSSRAVAPSQPRNSSNVSSNATSATKFVSVSVLVIVTGSSNSDSVSTAASATFTLTMAGTIGCESLISILALFGRSSITARPSPAFTVAAVIDTVVSVTSCTGFT